MNIENNQPSMVQLWLLLGRTEEVLRSSFKRFCPRNVMKLWHSEGIIREHRMETFMLKVCQLSELEGYAELRPVCYYPRKHRELLRAIIAVAQDIGMRHVDLRNLDHAFRIAFPHVTPLNVNKHKRTREP